MIINQKNKMGKFLNHAGDFLKRYRAEKDGSASIEFVFVAPILIFLYIGLYEVSIAFTVNGTVNNASEVAASFPTFEDELNEVNLAGIMTASTAVLDYPNFNIENLAIDIYSIEQTGDTADTRRLVGQAAYEGNNASGILKDLTVTDFQSQLSSLTAGNGFIVAQVAYRYEPSISSRYIQNVTLLDRKTLNPRENQGAALNITTTSGQERAILNCTPSETGLFSCSATGQFPDS
jgi:Flp pilus assembly protein TadG